MGAGESLAALNLGYAYHEGEGVKRNYRRAFVLYKKAARAGEVRAQWNLALCYLCGDGTRRDDLFRADQLELVPQKASHGVLSPAVAAR